MIMLSRLGQWMKTYSTGVIAAAVSVTFAGYMVLTGGKDAGLPESPVVVHHVPVVSPLRERLEVSIVPNHRQAARTLPVRGDMLITGSVTRASAKGSLLRRPPQQGRTTGRRNRPHYVLRFATREIALVEGSGRMWSVEPGDILPGAGRVVRIERRKRNHWVLKTFDGRNIREIGSR